MTFVDVTNTQDVVFIDSQEVENLITCLLKDKKISCDEISFHFVTKEEICQLHADFFNDPTPTDCITFPIDDEEQQGYRMLGEVFVCPQVALESIAEFKTTLSEELSLYVVHGLLHLLGYDDLEEEDLKAMRNEENRCIELLKKENLLLRPSVQNPALARK